MQVHTFSCMLVDNVVAYGDQSKTEDTASLRLISTQAPALLSALEVMVEQCYKRSVAAWDVISEVCVCACEYL